MRLPQFMYLFFMLPYAIVAQGESIITATLVETNTKEVIEKAVVSLEGSHLSVETDRDGSFRLETTLTGSHILKISAPDFVVQRMPIELSNVELKLGVIYLDRDISVEQTDNLITLTDAELQDNELNAHTSGLLQATKDVYLNRAAFDFGQAFFRVRGYDSRNGSVLLNGIAMNKFFDGRPQWNNWGGLNDVVRNQQFSNGLAASDFTFGGILGNTNIDTRPSGLRPGTRLSTSVSNRTYAGRLMATYTSGLQKNGLAYSVSGSRRWAKQGYIDGTLYDAFSLFGALEYRLGERHSLNFTGIWASNRRGRSSAITEEVFEIVGKRYNPYWGEQNGKIRNARERKIEEPIVMFNHYYESEKLHLNTGLAYQFGTNARSRLGYFNAPNPDPTYYRYLPSFYINSPIGANFNSANLAKEGFLENSQIDWARIYTANSSAQASYILYDDIAQDTQFTFNSIGNWHLNESAQIDFGGTYKKLSSANYARINDLLGAEFHTDIDPFSDTLNDVNGTIEKKEGDIFNYRYDIDASSYRVFSQFRYYRKRWNAFLSGSISGTTYQRNGRYENERFPENSFGKGKAISFSNFGVKSGFSYKLSGRHWLTSHAAFLNRPPALQNVFINPRENNEVVSKIQNETISTVDLNYIGRMPNLTGRITGFYTRFQNTTDVNFFFVDAGVGSDFVQEVLTDLDKLHLGAELGLEYQLTSSVKLTGVAALGKYLYASDPNVAINFDTVGREEDLIDPEGTINLGVAKLKDKRLAQGPQQAYALGIEYRDPKYWWVGLTANYLAGSYTNLSAITRTRSFYLDPDTGLPFTDATDENVSELLAQEPLDDFYLLNLVGGKSWLKKGKYISVFVSVNNLFDNIFRTGGYEQSRNGNFGQLKQDNLSGTPSFAPKYWYGYGRTYFLNMAFSF